MIYNKAMQSFPGFWAAENQKLYRQRGMVIV